jgi:hypothetical protein
MSLKTPFFMMMCPIARALPHIMGSLKGGDDQPSRKVSARTMASL